MRLSHVSVCGLLILLLAGAVQAGTCRHCGLVFEADGVYCADCARRFEQERERAAKELVHVEAVVKARRQYEKAIEDLVAYYLAEGNAQKAEDARHEQEDLQQVRKHDYFYLAELLSIDLKPKRSIAEADTLFRDGMNYYEQFTWPWRKKRKYTRAIEKFKELIRKYPESDRIDDAAYYLGRCYEKGCIGEYRRAVLWYQRCYQWNPETQHDARYRIARIYERDLDQRDKALQFYHLVVRDSGDSDRVESAQSRIDRLASRAKRERHEAVTMPEKKDRPIP